MGIFASFSSILVNLPRLDERSTDLFHQNLTLSTIIRAPLSKSSFAVRGGIEGIGQGWKDRERQLSGFVGDAMRCNSDMDG